MEDFEIRPLASEAELEPWLDLVVEVFGPLGIPRSYFSRHWSSDTSDSARLGGIFVAVERATGTMAATVRVFTRQLQVGAAAEALGGGSAAAALEVGGIGEVSTRARFRKRGLATRLLREAIRYMHEDRGMPLSALHAAAAASAMYRRLGWAPVATPLHRVSVPAPDSELGAALLAFCPEARLRRLTFECAETPCANPKHADGAGCDGAWGCEVLGTLAPLQARFTRQLDCFTRSIQHWSRWVRRPAEALDATGRPTVGVMRGFVMTGGAGSASAYLIAKCATSFSAGAEAGASGGGSGAAADDAGADEGATPPAPPPLVPLPPTSCDGCADFGAASGYEHAVDCAVRAAAVAAAAAAAPPSLTVLDFASVAPPGSPASEAALLSLLAHARRSFLGSGTAASDGVALTAVVPRLLAPAACGGDDAPQDTEQGTWMWMDVARAAAALDSDEGAPQDPVAVVRESQHLVLAIDEF